jgi:antitoxin (DNA-binding transcriptional repressor) of toxin-antitoxin stability system
MLFRKGDFSMNAGEPAREMTRDSKKIARKDGAVALIVGKQPIPKFCRVRQKFADFKIANVEAEVRKKLQRSGTLDRIKPGQSIAITAGSRGVTNIVTILQTIVAAVQRVGGKPFIVPAMGSHGGATAAGQLDVLTSYQITEKNIGCPIRSSMDTIQVGISEYGKPVHIDQNAVNADGIIIVGRVKPHTAFRGRYESGLLKMITIGLGKQFGAEICHADSIKYMEQNVTSIARVALENCRIRFGVAIVENAYDATRRIEAVPAEKFFEEEPLLLEEAKRNLAAILIDEVDVLIVDEIGKNISGSGMDPNITGTFATPYASGGIKKQKTVVLDITDESHGNTLGLGMADYSVQRAFAKMDFEKTYPNALTSTIIGPIKIPMILANDKLAIQAAIQTCNKIDYANPRIVRIKNSLEIGEILISESLLQEAQTNPQLEVLEGPRELEFDNEGNLF